MGRRRGVLFEADDHRFERSSDGAPPRVEDTGPRRSPPPHAAVDPLASPLCGGEVKAIAPITEHDVVDAIVGHLARTKMQEARTPAS
jgi:hypothetical protein